MSKTVKDTAENDKRVTIDELAEHCSVSRGTIKNWRGDNIIEPCIEIGNVVRFPLHESLRRIKEYRNRRPGKRSQGDPKRPPLGTQNDEGDPRDGLDPIGRD